MNREEAKALSWDIFNLSPGTPLRGRLCGLDHPCPRTLAPFTPGHSFLRRSCDLGTPSPNIHPSGQEHALPRSLCNLSRHLLSILMATGPSFPKTPLSKPEHHMSLSPASSPMPHRRFGAAWGLSCSGTVPGFWAEGPVPCGKRS